MSRKTLATGIGIVVAVSFLFVGVGPVTAHDGGNDVGASINCQQGSNGGSGSVGVSSDGSVDETSPSEGQDMAEGLAWGVQRRATGHTGDSCDGGSEDYDYLQVHAGDGDTQVQFCYSQDTNTDGDNNPFGVGTGDTCHE